MSDIEKQITIMREAEKDTKANINHAADMLNPGLRRGQVLLTLARSLQAIEDMINSLRKHPPQS